MNKANTAAHRLHSPSRLAGGGGGGAELSRARSSSRSSAMMIAAILLISCGILYHAYLPVQAAADSDRTLWNATITAGQSLGNSIVAGWEPLITGSIEHHAPTQDNTFVLDSATYTINAIFYAEETDPTTTDFYVDRLIPQSKRDSLYITMDDARCVFSEATEWPGNSNFYAWDTTLLAKPFSVGANTDVTLLYNQNYLSLNGASLVVVEKDAQYEDAGASAPDGATITDNSTNINTATPGTYTIQYTATKGCGVLDTAVRTIVVEERDTDPSFESAALDTNTGVMNVTFSKTINVSAVQLARLYVSDANEENTVSLSGAAFDSAGPNSNVLSLTLNQNQLNLIISMTEPQLDIEAGAVKDHFGNAIGDAPDGQILVFRTSADTVLWNATITAGQSLGNSIVAGWEPQIAGDIEHHAPTQDNTFALDSATYTINAIFYAEETDPTTTDFYIDRLIPQSKRDSLYITMDDARCVFSEATEWPGNSNFYAWDTTLLAKPFSVGANTDVTLLYNQNYLSLNGASLVVVEKDAQYEDAGASAPDGATITDNSTNINTATPGTYTIQYTATKGCGVLDTAVRTIVVEERDTDPSFESAALDTNTGVMNVTFSKTINVSAVQLARLYVSDANEENTVSLSGAAFDSAGPNSNVLSLTLNQNQLNLIISMTEPQLDIEAGAVKDHFGNAIGDAPDGQILVFRTSADTVLWNATITAGQSLGNSIVAGWEPQIAGDIEHHAPTQDNTFALDSATYTINAIFYAEETDPTTTDFYIDRLIPQSKRDSLYITMDDARCVFSEATEWPGNSNFLRLGYDASRQAVFCRSQYRRNSAVQPKLSVSEWS